MTRRLSPVRTIRWLCYLPSYCITLVRKITFLHLVSIISSVSAPVFASEAPKIGVVLSGGGAKGAAHVGVLKALEELQIPVDYIVGTSMGAYVGGLYATGMSASEIEALLTTVNWEEGYQDRVKRGERRVRDKQQEDRFQFTGEIGFDLLQLKVPRGFVQGQTMGAILRSTSGNLPAFNSFDQLAIPFRAVATDIETLTPVIIDQGDLAEAMQASMSIPGLLPPMELDDKLLVDGGITNNLPIDVVKAMGADIVIAVDISNDFKTRDELNNYFSVMDQLTDFMVRDNADRQITELTDQDFLIRPNIRGIKTTDFSRMPLALESGYVHTLNMDDGLASLGGASAFQAYIERKQQRRRGLRYLDEINIDNITLVNNSTYSDDVLLERLQLEAGNEISSEELADSVRSLYALDRFERVDYRIEHQEGENNILLEVKEKSWGPNFIDLRFAIEDDFENSTDYSLGLAFNVTGLSRAGAEWRTELEYGSDSRIATGVYLPFVKNQNFFSLLSAEYTIADKNLPLPDDEPSLEDIDLFIPATYTDMIFDGSFGWQPELWHEFRFGARYIIGETEFQGILNIGTDKRESRVAYIRYNLDTLDDFMLPKSGNYLKLEMAASDDTLRSLGQEYDDVSLRYDAEWKGAYTIGRHTLVGTAEYGRVESDLDLRLDPKEIGGFLNLSGIPKNSLAGNNKIFTAGIYRYHLTDTDFGLFNSSIYIGGSIEYGGVYNDIDLSFDDIPLYTAGSLYTGITTPFGPLLFAYGRTEQDNQAFYVFFGGAL
ncbi:patatin-like phospholipase family protein [Photobacterium minamisatsumaniensis]